MRFPSIPAEFGGVMVLGLRNMLLGRFHTCSSATTALSSPCLTGPTSFRVRISLACHDIAIGFVEHWDSNQENCRSNTQCPATRHLSRSQPSILNPCATD